MFMNSLIEELTYTCEVCKGLCSLSSTIEHVQFVGKDRKKKVTTKRYDRKCEQCNGIGKRLTAEGYDLWEFFFNFILPNIEQRVEYMLKELKEELIEAMSNNPKI